MSLFDTDWTLQVEKILPPVLRNANFVLRNGDFKLDDCDNLFIEYILLSSPGHWKERPLIGVGLINYLQGTQSPQVLQRNIRAQLEIDIFKRPLVDVSNFPTIIINKIVVTL